MRKMEKFISGNGFTSISFMHNNSFSIEGVTVCGTGAGRCRARRVLAPRTKNIPEELQRLEMSLQKGISDMSSDPALRTTSGSALHYPPFNSENFRSSWI